MLTLGLPALGFSLGAALAYSASDYFRKAVPADCPVGQMLFYAFLLEMPVIAAWLWISGDVRLTAAYLVPGLASAVIGLGANLLFIVAVRRSPLSLMVPMLGLIPVLTTLVGGVLLGEWPALHQAAGIVLVGIGLFTLYIPPHITAGADLKIAAVWRNFRQEPGAKPMAAVALLWSIGPPVDKLCLAHASVGVHALVQLLILCGTTGLWLMVRGGVRNLILPRAAVKPLLGMAVTSGLGYGMQLTAYRLTLVALVEVFKRSLGMAGALVMGRVFFGEPITPPKLIGIIIIALGLPLVMLG
jgi:drug/metabolite transporter (DMT)-like permease